MLIARFPSHDSKNRIMEIEKQYAVTFPEQYRRFLIKYNGGDTPNTKYKAGRKSSDLRGFYGFGDVRYSFDNFARLSEWIASKRLPIARDSYGNYISISLEDGKIYFVDHEHGFKEFLIFDDFMSFVKKCKSNPINELSRRSIEDREADLIAKGRGDVITDGLRQIWQNEIDKYKDMVQEELTI